MLFETSSPSLQNVTSEQKNNNIFSTTKNVYNNIHNMCITILCNSSHRNKDAYQRYNNNT